MQEWTWWVFGSRAVKDGRSMRFERIGQLAEASRALASAAMLSVMACTSDEQQSIVMRRLGKQLHS